ncbi:MAG: flagellar motor switch protein FliM [Planctomycetota bacterium]|jgi:flagellar motor switch protein FliM
MADQDKILSQHEVDALLSAIDSGDVEVGLAETPLPQATPYDFKRPERVARDQLRAIGTLHEVLARNLQTTLAGMLRTVVDVSVASVDQLTFSEFINSLPNPTIFTVISCEPLEGSFILEVNPTIAFPIIERLLGSRLIGSAHPEREFTPIEWNLIDRVVNRTLELMHEAWAKVADITFKTTNKANNPQLMQIMSPNEPVVMVVMEMAMGDHKGYLNMCVPVLTIEPLMEKISAHTWFASPRRETAPSQEQAITRSLSEAEMEAVAHMQLEDVSLSSLRSLSAGDILITSQMQSEPVVISVEGRPKFWAKLGSFRGRRAVQVKEGVTLEEEFKILQPVGSVEIARGEKVPEAKEPEEDLIGAEEGVEGILKIPVHGAVVLAEKTLWLKEILSLKPGDIIDFDKRIDEPLSLRAGKYQIARGMTVKIGEKFGLQVSEIGPPRQTVRSLGGG